MKKNWSARLAERQSRRRIARQAGQLADNHARGVTLLIAQQNAALRSGDAASVERANRALAGFLEAAAVAHAGAAGAVASYESLMLPPAAPGGAEPASVASSPAVVADPVQIETAPVTQAPGVNRYTISSATLAEAHAFLTQGERGGLAEPEYMLAVSGVEAGGVRTLERLIEVKLAHQSATLAGFDMQDFGRIALKLYEHGQMLHAVFHSHRFSGPPSPSGTDMRLQGILEEGGYPAIQAVFSEDGYVRFFAKARAFAVEIYGTGVKHVDGQPNTFRIDQHGTLPHPTAPAAARGRGDGVRPVSARQWR